MITLSLRLCEFFNKFEIELNNIPRAFCPYIEKCKYFLYNPEIMEASKCSFSDHDECHYYIYLQQVDKVKNNKKN